MMERLRIVITGCASGIGCALTEYFLQRGDRVCATDYDLSRLERRATELGWSNTGRIELRCLDVRKREDWDTLFSGLSTLWGRVDVLINNAGCLTPGNAWQISEAALNNMLDVNVKGVMLGTSVAGQWMVDWGTGHIINIASLAGIAPIPGLAVYCGSKHAVRGYSLAAAIELKDRGVYLSVLSPDVVDTPMLDVQVDYEQAALSFAGPRPLTTEDVVHAIEDMLNNRPLEVVLDPPTSGRGALAKLAGAFPGLGARFNPIIRKIGLRRQRKRRGK